MEIPMTNVRTAVVVRNASEFIQNLREERMTKWSGAHDS